MEERMPSSVRQLAWAAAFSGMVLAAPARADTYDIPVIVATSGGGAFVGKGQQTSLEAVTTVVNEAGGIDGRTVRFVFHDDQTSPQLTVQLTNQVLGGKPKAVLGSSLSAMCRAMGPLFKNGPLQFCLSSSVHPAVGSFTFSSNTSSYDQIAATVRYYRENGWTKIGALQTTDASGQDGDEGIKAALALPENKGMQLVAIEHFNPTDISVTAQIERIKQSGAQAMFVWSTGAPVATVFKGMIQSGLDLPVAVTNGNQTFEAMTQWKDFLPRQMLLPSSVWPPHAGLFQLDPRVEAAQAAMYKVYAARGIKPDAMPATSWDAALIVVAGLRKIGPNGTAAQLRDYIANLDDFAGINGMYDFRKYPERGLGENSAILTRYDAETGSFVWVSKPGGRPLGK